MCMSFYANAHQFRQHWAIAHWACTGVSGGWGESSLQEFDYNHETKSQVFMQINEF